MTGAEFSNSSHTRAYRGWRLFTILFKPEEISVTSRVRDAPLALRSPSRLALLLDGCLARQLGNQKAFGPREFAVESE
jgi:hypothetical protein